MIQPLPNSIAENVIIQRQGSCTIENSDFDETIWTCQMTFDAGGAV
jgi:hypothetical protein